MFNGRNHVFLMSNEDGCKKSLRSSDDGYFITTSWIDMMENQNMVPVDERRRWILARLLDIPPLLFGLQSFMEIYYQEENLMTHLYLIRHGSYINEVNGKLVDHGLSPLGVKQAELLRDRLIATGEIKADVLITSTLQRARHTAEVIASALNLPVVRDPDFEEWRNEDGSLSEEQFLNMWKDVPHDQRPYFRWIPAGENWGEFNLRATSAFNRLMQEYAGKTIVLVCHGGIVEASFTYFFGMNIHNLHRAAVNTDFTAITHWQLLTREGWPLRWQLERYNDRHHLDLSVFAEEPAEDSVLTEVSEVV